MLKVVVLVALALGSFFVLRSTTAQSPDKDGPVDGNFVLTVKKHQLKHDLATFQGVLAANSQQYCMKHYKTDVDPSPTPLEKNCHGVSKTSAEVTNTAEYTLICAGAHVTQSCAFNTVAQLQAVVAELVP
jgi:hypothetical protein